MKIKEILLYGIGFIMLALGIVGIFLPVWPTTPFIVAASLCFASNPVLFASIKKTPFFGEYIRNYKDRKGISKRTMTISLIFLWGMLSFAAFYVGKPPIMCLLAVIGIAVTIHIVWIAKPGKEKSDALSNTKSGKT